MHTSRQHRDPAANLRMQEVSVKRARSFLFQIVQNERRLPKPDEMAELISIECPLEMKYQVIKIDNFLRIGQDKLSNIRSVCQVVRNKFKQLLLVKEDRSLDWSHLRAAYCKSLPGIDQLLSTIGYHLRGDSFVADESRMTMQATVNFLVDISMLVEEIGLYLSGQHSRMGFFKGYLFPHGVWSEETGMIGSSVDIIDVNPLLIVRPEEVPEDMIPPPDIRPQEIQRPPPPPKVPAPEVLCDLCGDERVALVCTSEACPRRNLCLGCDQRWHGHPQRRGHKREGASQDNLRRTAATMPRLKTESLLDQSSPQQQQQPGVTVRRVVTRKDAASYKSQLKALFIAVGLDQHSDTDSDSDAEKKQIQRDDQASAKEVNIPERQPDQNEQKHSDNQSDELTRKAHQEEQEREQRRQEEQQREKCRQEEQEREQRRQEEQEREQRRQEEQERDKRRQEEQEREKRRQEEQEREQRRQEEQQREQRRQEEQEREHRRQEEHEREQCLQEEYERERENLEREQHLERRQRELEDNFQALTTIESEEPMETEDAYTIVDGVRSATSLFGEQAPSSMVVIDQSVLEQEQRELNQLSEAEANLDERQDQLYTYLMNLQQPVEKSSESVSTKQVAEATFVSDAPSNSDAPSADNFSQAQPPLKRQPEVPARPELRPRPQVPPRPDMSSLKRETPTRPEVPPRPPPPVLEHPKVQAIFSDTEEEYYTPRSASPQQQQVEQTWTCPFCTAISPRSELKTIASSGRIVCPVCSMTSDKPTQSEVLTESAPCANITISSSESSGWLCEACTYFNVAVSSQCEMCNTRRPNQCDNVSSEEATEKLIQALSLARARGLDPRLVSAALVAGCSHEESRLDAWIAKEWPRRVEMARFEASRQYSAEFTQFEAEEALADNPHRLASNEEAAAAVLEICAGKRETLVRQARALYPQLQESDLRAAAGEKDWQRTIGRLNSLAMQQFLGDLQSRPQPEASGDALHSDVAMHALMAEHGLRSEALARRLAELQSNAEFKRYQTEDLIEAVKNTDSHSVNWNQAVVTYLNKECVICLEQYPRHHFLGMLCCNCEICRGCFHRMVTTNIKDMHITHLVCPACAKPTPNEIDQLEMHFAHVMALINNFKDPELRFDQKDRDRLADKTLDWQIMRNPNFIWCSSCAAGFEFEPGHPLKIRCPSCHKTTCRKCRKPWETQHKDISCEEFQRWKQENDPDFQAKGVAFYLQQHGIECPACHFKYALAGGGCLHFICRMCRAQFCSGCNQLFIHDESRGLTCKHPRSCLYHLRDFDIERLQDLLKRKRVEFESGGVDDVKVEECQVMEQKEIAEGLKDEACSRKVKPGHANLCDKHYCEYLVTLINKNRLDPVEIMTAEELVAVCRRHGIRATNESKAELLRQLIVKQSPIS